MSLFPFAILRGLFSARPTDNRTGTIGRLYHATDTNVIYRDNGTTWDVYGLAIGTGATDAAAGNHNHDTVYLKLVGGTLAGELVAPDVKAAGLTGATAASRYVGATASGAPTTGTFALGDFIVDQTGKVWVCTTAGTPGTWTQAGGSGSPTGAAGGDLAGTYPNPTLNNSSTARTNLGLGSAATHAAGDFEPALGNPSTDGYLLSSSAAGVRLWVAPGTAGMSNPMTTAGDIILAGSGGTPTRLAKGADNYVFTIDPTTHLPVWAALAAGTGAHTIADEGTPLTARATLDFQGTGVTATDDATGNRTIVTIPGGSSGGASMGTYAARPAAGTSGRLYAPSDYPGLVFYDTGTAWVVWQGNSIDVPPASPNTANDEFSSSTLNAKWTAVTTTTAPTWDIHTTVPGALYASFGRAVGSLTLTQTWAPTKPYSVTLCYNFTGSRAFQSVNLYVLDSGGTNGVNAGIQVNASGGDQDGNPRGFMSQQTSGSWFFNVQNISAVAPGRGYFHLQVDSSDNWSIAYSRDGVSWYQGAVSTRPFTAGKLQLVVEQNQSTRPQRTTVEWIRANVLTL